MNANVKKYLTDVSALEECDKKFFEECQNYKKLQPKYFHPKYFISVWSDLGEGMQFTFSQWRKVERKIKLGFNSQNLTEITVVKL